MKSQQAAKPEKHILSLDLETYSSEDLSKCGVYRYSEADDFEILLLAYAFDDEEVEVIDMACGEQIPKRVLDAIDDTNIIKAAWNAQFERTCIGRYLGRVLSPDSWQCSMVWAASLSLPFSLKEAARVLKTGEQKDRAGENLIRYFSIPCAPTKTNGGRTRNLPEHYPDGWAQFKSYCQQDVRTERDIRKKLESFPMPDSEWEVYHMDQRINDRGVLIDMELVEQAIKCDLMFSETMSDKAYELTGIDNPNSVSQLKSWLESKGLPVDTLGKKNVEALIQDLEKDGCDDQILEMLKLRLQMAKSSVKKYQAADRCVCKDNRARGLFQYYGANRTGRWCLAEGTPILVKDENNHIYEKPIEEVTETDLVFDGENWVHHEGVIFSGEHDVIEWDGITATAEHEVYLDELTSIPLIEAKEKGLKIWRGKKISRGKEEANEHL